MRKTIHLYSLLALFVLLVLGYAWQIEPRRLVVRRLTIKDSVLARAWPGLTIVHLADPHIAREGVREARILATIKELKPDLILMSGDYRQWHADPGPAQHFLSQLSAPLGVYGVLGDADQGHSRQLCAYCHPGDTFGERLALPVILQNERREIPFRGRTITVVGVDLVEAEGSGEWLREIQAEASQKQEPLLVLSHQSALWSAYPLATHSLWLTGDSHGGQVWLPEWLWKVVPGKPDPAHMGGLYGNGQGGWLLVNRGLGQTARFPFRLGVPPELVVITFAEE